MPPPLPVHLPSQLLCHAHLPMHASPRHSMPFFFGAAFAASALPHLPSPHPPTCRLAKATRARRMPSAGALSAACRPSPPSTPCSPAAKAPMPPTIPLYPRPATSPCHSPAPPTSPPHQAPHPRATCNTMTRSRSYRQPQAGSRLKETATSACATIRSVACREAELSVICQCQSRGGRLPTYRKQNHMLDFHRPSHLPLGCHLRRRPQDGILTVDSPCLRARFPSSEIE